MTLPNDRFCQRNDESSLTSRVQRKPVLLVTGVSGAGRSTTLKILEDLGYEAVDNLPLTLLSNLVAPEVGALRPLAIGIDIRTRGFFIDDFLGEIDALIKRIDLEVRLIFLDCDDDVLQRRFTETRRRHPLAADRPVMAGIRRERQSILNLQNRADLTVDTSELALNDLKRLLRGHFSLETEAPFVISVISFSYRHGIPREADLVFDARFLSNPFYEEALKSLTGLDEQVVGFVSKDPNFPEFFESFTSLLKLLIPRFQAGGKSYLTIAVGCTGGQHRSVVVVEKLAKWLRETGNFVDIMHRELLGGDSHNSEEQKIL